MRMGTVAGYVAFCAGTRGLGSGSHGHHTQKGERSGAHANRGIANERKDGAEIASISCGRGELRQTRYEQSKRAEN